MPNENLTAARNARNDEFYTQFSDIEKEVSAYKSNTFRDKTVLLPCDDPEWSNFTRYFALHFEDLGLKKLISTSYAPDSKKLKFQQELTLFETESPQFDPKKAQTHGKIFVLDRDMDGNGRIDIDDLEWQYLDGDGDFRSDEVKALREEADIIITNPPFSLFREFLTWVMEAEKKFLILGNMNAITYKEVFPLIKENKVWTGYGFNISLIYKAPYENLLDANRKFVKSKGYNPDDNYIKVPAITWFTNLEHGKRHHPLSLMTMAENLKFSKHKEIKGKTGYEHYDNYDAIDVPFVDAIPSDYDGVMGLPISFIGKYCPEQFEIIKFRKGSDDKDLSINGKYPYFRILIRKKQ